MKILYFTDTHIRGNNPANRIDIFVDSLENKFYEILDIINDKNIDFVLHGGDLFDRPDVSISVVNRFVNILNQIKVPFYLIAGNHDMYGHNPRTVNRTVLSLLNILDLVTIINKNDKIILEKNDLSVQLTGQSYIYDIDKDNNIDYYSPKEVDPTVNYSIHMVHGMLLDKPFVKGIPYTLIEDIKSTKADIVLSGHYHSGFETAYINDKYFINPGSLVRINNSITEMKRRPKVVVLNIDSNNINIEEIYLKNVLNGNDVFDRSKIKDANYRNERMHEFKQTIDSAINFEKLDVNELIIEVSNAHNVEEEVKKEAIKRIARIQMKGMEE